MRLTTTLLDAEHPFVVFVTVKLYVPAVLTVGEFVVPPDTIVPDQAYVIPAPEEEPVPSRTTEVVVQVSVLLVPALAVGNPPLAVTTIASEAEHPFAVFVTVKLYVPTVLTVGELVVPPDTIVPDQAYVIPAPDEEPVPSITADVAAQVSVLSAPAFAVGSVLSIVTTT